MNLQILLLRAYQDHLVNLIFTAWQQHRCVLLWLATGGGKTEIAAYIAESLGALGGCTLFVVERKTLARQAIERFKSYGLTAGVIRGEDTYVGGYESVIVASIQTLRSRWDHPETKADLERVNLIVIDEAHIQYDHHKELLKHLPRAKVLGLSATPLRDGLGLTYETLVRGSSYRDLIDQKYLVPPRYFLPHTADIQAGLQDVDIASTGDYDENQLSLLMRRRVIVGDIVSTWLEKAQDRRTVVFCVDIAHARDVCDAFCLAGVAAEQIDMHTKEDERTLMSERFRGGETQVLCSVDVLGIGFDEPLAACAVLARPTRSLILHIQQVGRALRKAPEKTNALILDHAGNVMRHGKVEDFSPPELSRLDKKSDKSKGKNDKDYFPCPQCSAVMEPGQRVCHECGHELERKNNVHHLDGELVEEHEDRKERISEWYRELYQELRYIAETRYRKEPHKACGQAWKQILEHFGYDCPWIWRALPTKVPSNKTLRLEKSWRIAYAKRTAKQEGHGPYNHA